MEPLAGCSATILANAQHLGWAPLAAGEWIRIEPNALAATVFNLAGRIYLSG
jgi:hypothetical protein